MRGAGLARLALLALSSLGAVPRCVHAQGQPLIGTRVEADNDAFNFWLPPWSRPDEEYTSGVLATVEYAGLTWWQRLFDRSVAPCGYGSGRCATKAYSLGQDIYTGARQVGDTAEAPGSRPNAGWLFLEETGRVASATRLDETSLSIGVTGSPALASYVQRIVHGYDSQYNRPTDWTHQLPFEPGFIARYERTERMFVLGDVTGFGADVLPHAGAALGTILTEAVVGVRARAGFGLNHPWLLAPARNQLDISIFADASGHGVLRNEFLAGTFFRSSDHVQERPFVGELQGGLTARWQQVALTYRADWTGSEYTTRADGHMWSSIGIEWRPPRSL